MSILPRGIPFEILNARNGSTNGIILVHGMNSEENIFPRRGSNRGPPDLILMHYTTGPRCPAAAV